MAAVNLSSLDTLSAGKVIQGKFRIVDLLGFSQWGAVYRAVDLSNSSDFDGSVALKILSAFADKADEKLAVQTLRKEIRTLTQLRAAETALNEEEKTEIFSTPKFYGGSTELPERFVAQELMRGKQVSVLLAGAEPDGLAEPAALNIAYQLFRLLDLLHTRLQESYVDLKLENLWWTAPDGRPGEGLLKVTEWTALESLQEKSHAVKRQYIVRDIFRASLYLYRMVTGTLPTLIGGTTVSRMEDAHRWGSLSSGMQSLLHAALVLKKYSSAGELKLETYSLLHHGKIAVAAPELPAEVEPEKAHPETVEQTRQIWQGVEPSSPVEEEPPRVNDASSQVEEAPSLVVDVPSQVEEEPPRVIEASSQLVEEPSRVVEAPSQVEEILREARGHVQANNFSQAAADFGEALSLAETPHAIFDEIMRIARGLEQNERYDELLTLTQYTGSLELYGEIKDLRRRAFDAREIKQAEAWKKQLDEAANLEAEKIRDVERRKHEAEKLHAEAQRQKDALDRLEELRKACTLGITPGNWSKMVQKARLLQFYPEYPELHREALLLFMQVFRAAGPQLEAVHLQEFEALLPDFPKTVSRDVQTARIQAEAVRRTWQEREEAARKRIEWEQSLAQKEQLLARLKEGDLTEALQIARQMNDGGTVSTGEIPGLFSCLKPHTEKIVEAGLAEEFEHVFAPWLKPASQRSFTNELRNILSSQLSNWFEPVREALQQGNGLLALKEMEALLLQHPQLPAGLDVSWHGHWKGVLYPLVNYLSTDMRLDVARLRVLLAQLAFAPKDQAELAEAIDDAAQRQKQTAGVIEQRQRSDELLNLLKGGQYSQAVDYAEAWLAAAPDVQPDQTVLLPAGLAGAQKLAEGDDLPLLRRYVETLGRLTRVDGFGSGHEAHFWERSNAALQARFSELSQAVQTEPKEKVLPRMQALFGMGDALAPELEATWKQGWQQLIVQALNLSWADQPAGENHLAFIANRIWPAPEERQVLAKAIEQARAEQQKASEEIRSAFKRDYLNRLTDLEILAGNGIYQKRQSKELTLGLYRQLIQQVKELLPDAPSSDPILQRLQNVTAEKITVLQQAEELWTRARRSKDPAEKQKIVDELLRRQFYGWKLPGDFEQELGLKGVEVVREPRRAVAGEVERPARPAPVAEVKPVARQTAAGEARQNVAPLGHEPVPDGNPKISVTFKQLKSLRQMQWVYPLQCKQEIQAMLDAGVDEASQRDLENILDDFNAQDPKLLEKLEQAAQDNLDDINYGIDLQKLCAGLKALPRYSEIVDARKRLRQRNAPPAQFGGR